MNQLSPPPSKRIEYIDALRGFTMILVVFAHVESHGFFHFSHTTFLGEFFQSFRMPLFFFISGYIAYRASTKWDKETYLNLTKKKIVVQLVPTVVFGLLYTYCKLHSNFSSFIYQTEKYGYWFTLSLLEIFLIVYTLNLCVWHKDEKIYHKRLIVSLVILSALLYLTKFILKINPTMNMVGNMFCLHYTFGYFQYFAFGYILSTQKELFKRILESKYFIGVVIILYVMLFYMQQTYIGIHVSGNIDSWKVIDTIAETIIGYLGIILIFNTFRVNEDVFASTKKIGAAMQYIGKRTLDVYMLHYFFIPVLPTIGLWLKNTNLLVVELFVGITIALIVVFCCLLVSNIIRTNPWLAKYLFGVKDRSLGVKMNDYRRE